MVFPQESETRETTLEQIFGRNITVSYQCTIRVRCIIAKNVAKDLQEELEKIKHSSHWWEQHGL